MNGYFYSASINMFYPASLRDAYEQAGTWPEDAVECEDSVYQEFAANPPSEGKMRVAGEDGMPAWDDIPPPTDEQILFENTNRFNRLMRACTDAAFPIQSRIALGTATDEQLQVLAVIQQYAADLIDPAITDLTTSPARLPAPPDIVAKLI